MAQSLTRILVHLIYSTKHRKPFLTAGIRPKLFAYQAGIFQRLDCPAIVIGGVDDHVHALFVFSKNRELTDVIEYVKKDSSKWIKTQGTSFGTFQWQRGYAAFSVSPSNAKRVQRYIDDQAAHHKTMSFQDELRLLLKRHGVEFDERYVWD